MYLEKSSIDAWVIEALAGFPDQIQERIILKMIDAEQIKSDAFAELRAAERLKNMGFTVTEGNGKEGVFRVSHPKENAVWVISCSLSRFMTRKAHHSQIEFMSEVEFAKRRAIKHCLAKIPDNEAAMICLHISPDFFGEKYADMDKSLFQKDGRYPIIPGKLGKRLTGILVAYGEAAAGDSDWVFHRPYTVN